MQRYVVGHPIIFRRGETKVKNLGLQDYLINMNTSGVFEDNSQYIDFGNGAPGFTYFDGGFYLGAKNAELRNTKSSNLNFWGIPKNSVLRFLTENNNDSFKYAIIHLIPRNNFATDLTLFANDFAGSKGFKSTGDSYTGYLDDMTIVNATLYPFVYEKGSSSQQKLTTYSVKTPNSSSERNRMGTEPLELLFGNGNWSVYGSSWSSSGYQDYANKLINHLGSYTQQISGSTITWGFLAILRGSLPNNWTPRRHILWFLQRCTDIDTTNDWSHIQLT